MIDIKLSRLKHNPSIFNSIFKTIGDTTICKQNIRIVFPDRYVTRGLATLGSTVNTLGMYAIIDDDDNYCVSLASIKEDLAPYNIHDQNINGDEYKILSFRAGDPVIVNNNLVVSGSYLYELFDEFIIKGNIPFFLSYEEIADILLKSKEFNDSAIGKNPLTMEILTAVIARSEADKRVFFRQSDVTKKPIFVGLNNIYYSFDTTGAKLIGGYFGPGVTTALVDKEEKTSMTTAILRA